MGTTNRIYGYQDGAGDHDSHLRQFTQFCREHETSIFAYILRMIGFREAAEDITQETLLQYYRRSKSLGYPDIKECYRIATALTIKYLRKKGPARGS